jgi:hypothetical protein
MLSKRSEFLPDDKVGVVMNPVIERCCSKKNIRVGREGCARVGKSPSKQHAATGQAVYIGRGEVFFGVATQPVRTESVDGNEKEVMRFPCFSERVAKITEKENTQNETARKNKTRS